MPARSLPEEQAGAFFRKGGNSAGHSRLPFPCSAGFPRFRLARPRPLPAVLPAVCPFLVAFRAARAPVPVCGAPGQGARRAHRAVSRPPPALRFAWDADARAFDLSSGRPARPLPPVAAPCPRTRADHAAAGIHAAKITNPPSASPRSGRPVPFLVASWLKRPSPFVGAPGQGARRAYRAGSRPPPALRFAWDADASLFLCVFPFLGFPGCPEPEMAPREMLSAHHVAPHDLISPRCVGPRNPPAAESASRRSLCFAWDMSFRVPGCPLAGARCPQEGDAPPRVWGAPAISLSSRTPSEAPPPLGALFPSPRLRPRRRGTSPCIRKKNAPCGTLKLHTGWPLRAGSGVEGR